MRETCQSCRRPAPAWQPLSIVLNIALSFDFCGVPLEAFASQARRLDELVDSLLPLITSAGAVDETTKMRMRLPRTSGGLDITPNTIRPPM